MSPQLRIRLRLTWAVCVGCLLSVFCVPLRAEIPKNVILFIGDGMGFEHVEAANYFGGGPLSFEQFAHQGQVTTHTANSSSIGYPDSAATAAAMATGRKVDNGVISVNTPGDGSPLTTLLEIFQRRGKATGLVTNTPMTGATPAAFAAHQADRHSYGAIADDMVATKPNVLFGSVAKDNVGMTRRKAAAARYSVVTSKSELDALGTTGTRYVSGQFGIEQLPYEYDGTFGDLPHLSQMTSSALNLLQKDSDGFFLMVEGGLIDWAAHAVGIGDKSDPLRFDRTVAETMEFGNSVQTVLDWAGTRDDTLVLVTADHETGGLTFTVDTDADGNEVVSWSWSTTGHTNANVPIYAWGANAHLVEGVMDNTDIFRLASVPEPSSLVLLGVGALLLAIVSRRSAARRSAA